MKQFLFSALGALVGTIIGFFVMGFIVVIFTIVGIAGMFSSLESKPVEKVAENSILHLKLQGEISDKIVANDDFSELFGTEETKTKLYDIIKSIESAKDDNNIVGIFLDCRGVGAGLATCTEIRNAVENFKESNKWVYAYGDSYTQADYYIASVADSLFINPEGMLDLHGLSTSIPYFKKLLDKIGVEVQVFKVGTFKSAVEPYLLSEMSEANKLQTKHFMVNMWKNVSDDICNSRKLDSDKFNELVDGITATQPTAFLIENKLVDAKCYAFEFIKNLKGLTNVEKGKNLKFVTPKEYINTLSEDNITDEKIVVLYAEGEINSENPDGIVAKNLIEDILSSADDDDVKGLVMRVNSPGGSAFDSEQIWAALEVFKKKGKPFAVSMGDYAASGGYYISCGADKIFAEKNTLTGSIGIFGMVPNVKNLINDFGVNVCEVSTNPNANFPSLDKPMTHMQLVQMQKMVERGYDLFTTRCAEGRNMPIDSLKMIAEGRVWDGKSALDLGLVDGIGNIDSAIEWVAEEAGIIDYKLVQLPESTDAFDYYINKYFGEILVNNLLGKSNKFIDQKRYIENIINIYPVQARMNMSIEL